MEDIKGAFRHIPLRKKGVGILLGGLVLAVYFLSGVYTVAPGEVSVATIFGKEVRQEITEGLHYKLPWPFEAIEKVNVSEIRRIDVGAINSEKSRLFPKKQLTEILPKAGGHSGHGALATSPETTAAIDSAPFSAQNQFFTGDENILEIRMNIQYQVKDASDYLFNMSSPDALVPDVTRAAVTEYFALMPVEDLLTVAKSQIQKRIAQKAQGMLDEYGTGLYIVNVNLQEVNPPKDVAEAFRDVSSAREEREEKRAEDYDNNVGLNEMNRPKIEEVMFCFEQGKSVTVPIVVINEDGSRPIKEITLDMEDKKVLIFDGLYTALIGEIKTGESKATRIIAMNEKKFNLDAQKERGKEDVNEHRMNVLERECNAVRSLWPHVTHKITEDWQVASYTHM